MKIELITGVIHVRPTGISLTARSKVMNQPEQVAEQLRTMSKPDRRRVRKALRSNGLNTLAGARV